MLVYSSSIDLSSRTLRFFTGQLAARRAESGTRWRRLAVGRQAHPAAVRGAAACVEHLTSPFGSRFCLGGDALEQGAVERRPSICRRRSWPQRKGT